MKIRIERKIVLYLVSACIIFLKTINCNLALLFYIDSRSKWPRGLRRGSTAARCCDRGFESHRGHGCLSGVCCQVEVSATSCSLVQRSPTDCGASLCVIKKPRERGGHSPRCAAGPEKINIFILIVIYLRKMPIDINNNHRHRSIKRHSRQKF
jgi:hypothetical protein